MGEDATTGEPRGGMLPWWLRVTGREKPSNNLPSHDFGVVGCVHLEATVLGPQVDRVSDAGAAPLVDLGVIVVNALMRPLATGVPTISADSVPAMLNSSSAYFFQ